MAELENMSHNHTGAGSFNGTGVGTSETPGKQSLTVAASFSLLISILGMIGNSLVFWYLTFKIKRTKYTVYIINLAVADLIYLICYSISLCIVLIHYSDQGPEVYDKENVLFALEVLYNIGMAADMFILTAISVERCLAVFYPVWYLCKRPKVQSVLVCICLWGLSILVALVDLLGCPMDIFDEVSERCTAVYAFLSTLVFLVIIPIMVVSSMILLIRIHKTSRQYHPRKLFIVIVASVILFLISVAPVRLLWLLLYLQVLPSSFVYRAFYAATYMLAAIHSSINPFIYFLVGTEKIHCAQEFLINALKKVFKEEEDEAKSED